MNKINYGDYILFNVYDQLPRMPSSYLEIYLKWRDEWTKFQKEEISGMCVVHKKMENELHNYLETNNLKILEKEKTVEANDGYYRVDYIVENQRGDTYALELGGLYTKNPRKKIYDLCHIYEKVIHLPYGRQPIVYTMKTPPPPEPELDANIIEWIKKDRKESMLKLLGIINLPQLGERSR